MRHLSFKSIFFVLFFLLQWVLATGDAKAMAADTVGVSELVVDSSVTVSLLTCSPGQEAYELYGHTAIRVVDSKHPTGVVYNYGAFDFHAPHFVWRFVLGECDYLLWAEPLELFLIQYQLRGSSVQEQVLNLTPHEATCLRDDLQTESLPENRVYRYNIFRSNCTTRARDAIERCIYGYIEYPARPRRNTFRSILHQFTDTHRWSQEGNDLLLGEEVDTLIDYRDEMFSPIYLMWYVDSAMINNGRGVYRNLVRERRLLLPPDAVRQQAAKAQQPNFPLSPAATGWLLLAVGLCLAAFEAWRLRICWLVDMLLMTMQGLAGILLCFMAMFSVHPGVASNWQVWVLNPLPLFFVFTVVRSDIRRQRSAYHPFAAVFLLAFVILYFFIPQHFSELILPMALLLLSRAVVHLFVYRK